MTTNEATLRRLIDDEDPVPAVWDELWNIWSPPASDVSEHYDREKDSVNFEWLLHRVYEEFYIDLLAQRCVTEPSLSVPEDGALVIMDAMSVREASLFVKVLREEGWDVDVDFDYATVPSETLPFRERVGYDEQKGQHKSTHISSQTPNLNGDEEIVWAPYPDTLAENIQEGHTELSSVEEMYEKTEAVLRSILDQLDARHISIRSDHGYVRLESGHTFPISEGQKTRLKEVFSGSRYASVDEIEADDLVDEGLLAEADGYYLPVGRFTWPARGKYTTYQHGGLSLTEVLTPKLEVIK